MSISNNCAEDNSVPYTSFFDIEKSFSPVFFGNKQSSKRIHHNYNGRYIETAANMLAKEEPGIETGAGVPVFSDNLSHETYMFL